MFKNQHLPDVCCSFPQLQQSKLPKIKQINVQCLTNTDQNNFSNSIQRITLKKSNKNFYNCNLCSFQYLSKTIPIQLKKREKERKTLIVDWINQCCLHQQSDGNMDIVMFYCYCQEYYLTLLGNKSRKKRSYKYIGLVLFVKYQ